MEDTDNFDGQVICGFVAMSAGPQCKWKTNQITWTIIGQLPGISSEDLFSAYKEAWSYWERVCNLKATYVENDAMVLMGTGKIDSEGQVLAWSEMPCGNTKKVEQKYDTSERWIISVSPPNNKIDLVRVACHEIGHALGIPHIANGNLMQPQYDIRIRMPQRGDIVEAIERYGKFVPAPEPTPPPDVPTPEPTPTPVPTPVNWIEVIKSLIISLFKVWLDSVNKVKNMFK